MENHQHHSSLKNKSAEPLSWINQLCLPFSFSLSLLPVSSLKLWIWMLLTEIKSSSWFVWKESTVGLWERPKWVKSKSNELQQSKITAHFNHQLVVTAETFCQPYLLSPFHFIFFFANATKSVRNLISLCLSAIIKTVA